jgi:CubicO group peptidase (beta-lactamase class C family)
LPALAGLTFTAEALADVAALGVRKRGDDTRVTPDDLWHIGSITKSFTSLLVARMVERGDLAWATTVSELFGTDAGAYGAVTVAQLLGHRSGLPANATAAMLARPAGASTSTPESVVDVRRRVSRAALATTPSGEPGVPFLYSNLGYTVLASALESKTGRSWEDLLQTEILGPLNLASAGHGAPGVMNALTQPRGHRGGTTPLEPSFLADNPPYLGPAGRLHMTVKDLARWGQVHLAAERGQARLVSQATFNTLHTPARTDNPYAMGWVREGGPGAKFIWHNGSNTYWYAIVAFVPEKNRGVALVSNGGIEARTVMEPLVRALLR